MSAAVALAAAPDPFLAAIRELHKIQDLVEQIGREAVLEAYPALASEWVLQARRNQLPPATLERTWVQLCGRGAGKTRSLTAAAHIAVKAGIRRIGIIAPTSADIRDVLVDGPAGLRATAPAGMCPTFTETKRKIVWPNGAQALTFSALEPDSLRGPEFELVLIDELATMDYGKDVLDMASLGLRIGAYPRMLIATTPRPKPWLKALLRTPGVTVTHAATWANEMNLAPSFLADLKATWEGRRLALQELEGLIVEDDDAELFKSEWMIEDPVPDEMLERMAVGIDPSGGADVIGIVACARLVDGRYAVLADRSCKGSPAHWSEQAILLHDQLNAEDLVVEVNYGGQMATDTIKQTAIRMHEQGKREEPFIRVKEVVAHRGKAVRAEPISALFEQGKVLLRPGLSQLKAELLNFTTYWDRKQDASPNRMDAMVWSLTRLKALILDIPMA
jgi:phage terminase large subunit-like protein